MNAIHDFFKGIESKAYDQAAEQVTDYARGIKRTGKPGDAPRDFVDNERVEATREIRQRGHAGIRFNNRQLSKLEELGIDENTRNGRGPIVFVLVDGDRIPDEALPWLAERLTRDPRFGGPGKK